jgi:hypothetical protein
MIAPWALDSDCTLVGMLGSVRAFAAVEAPAGGARFRSSWSGAASKRVPLRDAGANIGGTA